jgi:hypothetical protein
VPDPSELLSQLRIGELLADAVTRSYLADDRVVGWYGGPGAVIDAEIAGQHVPRALAARFGVDDFWARWTQAECAAKLADVPIMIWISTHGLGPASYDVTTVLLEDVVVSVGFPAA